MSTVSGNDGVVKVGGSALAKVTAWTVTRNANMERDDGMGEAWQSDKAGKKRWTASITMLYDDGGDALEVGEEGSATLYPAGTAVGKKYYSGNFVVSEVGHPQDQDSRVTQTIQVSGQGALSETTVAA